MNNAIPVLALIALFPIVAKASDRSVGKTFVTRSEVISQHGMAATSHPLATQIAIDILKKGGNAIDAAIAANSALALMEPTGCGLGGDLFAIVWDTKTKKLHGLNSSGRSPYSLTFRHFKELGLTSIPSRGPLPVSVPGAVAGWFKLHERFGKLSIETILSPAIHYARVGFPVTKIIAADWQVEAKILSKWPGFKKTFMPEGSAPTTGQVFKNPDLARTLEKITKGGSSAFYKGEIARTIDAYMARNNGFLSYRDLSEHTSEWVEPVSTNYRGYDVWELPPNGQGIAALQILNILEGFNIKKMGFGSKEYIHHFLEAKKLAFEDRAKFYADPEFNNIPVKELISKEYASKRRHLINPHQASHRYDAGNPVLTGGDTIYLTTADETGNMVSLIQSNFRSMGSGMTPDGLGFVLQTRGELFNLKEGHFNSYAPHKRPFHTIIPAFITKNGKPFLSFGVMGGALQPQMHAQIVMNIVDFNMDIQEAGDAPRISHRGSSQPTGEEMADGGTVILETGFTREVIRDLVRMGHKIQVGSRGLGGYQAIKHDGTNKTFYGASESRKDGHAAGY